jgi:[acyl-carrier-protein] S-malonyltransferase
MLAFVFPGQGSQRVGMGKDLARVYPVARTAFEEAEDVLGIALRRLCFEGPEDRLRLTANAQPALLAVGVATLRVLETHTGASPALVAGHSLGEYTALVCAGVMRFEDALRVVRRRGELMQQAVAPGVGGMTAVLGLGRDVVTQLCGEAAGDWPLEVANENAPTQFVVAGAGEALERLLPLVRQRGGMSVPLNVSAPFHCALMRPAAEQLRAELRTIRFSPPRLPVIGNVLARPYQPGEDVAELLARQVVSPVRWTESVRELKARSAREVLEVGPGQVLTRLVRQAEPDLACENVETSQDVCRVAARTAGRRAPRETQDWVRRGFRLVSPDGTRCRFDDGLEWDAALPGACGF